MTLGDRLRVGALVRNYTDREVSCTVVLGSGEFEVVSEKQLSLKIAGGETGVAEWDIRAVRCGENTFTVSLKSEPFDDSETRTIFVRPAGEPLVKTTKGTLDKSAPWQAEVALSGKATYRTAFLNVSFPNVFPALQGLEAMARYPHGCVEQTASQALVNVAVLEYGLRTGMPEAMRLALVNSLRHAAARITAMQYPDGAWGWFYLADATAPDSRRVVGGPNLYLTAYALRTLLEIRDCDIPVSNGAIESAVEYILKARNPDGLWSAKGAFFWETVNDATHKGLSAELFYVLARAIPSLPPAGKKKYRKRLDELKEKMAAYLAEQPDEPLAVANAVSGLQLLARAGKDKALAKQLEESITYLIGLKRKGYWEPHWYHAFGGMIELNARILELLHATDPQRYNGFLREGVTWLLSTREAWGAWHNTAGTAAAVRALLKTGAFDKEVPSRVVVKVNGKAIAEVAIDPADPYLSAARLRCLELTRFLANGANRVEVAYDGNLKASVILQTRQWGLPGERLAGVLSIERSAPKSVELGEPFPVTLKIASKKLLPYLVVEERFPANAEVEKASLQALMRKGAIADYKLDGATLYLYLEKLEGSAELTYRLTATRAGGANHAGSLVSAMYDPSVSASTVDAVLEVKP
jgi:uncharacterized protein YfaS (alpha-2-macroglobulin family)